MAHGDNHAKQTVLNQAKALEKKLSNGHKADPETHGMALLLLLQMIQPIFLAKLITDEECSNRMALCPGAVVHKKSMGWPAALTTISAIGGLIVLILRLAGKM